MQIRKRTMNEITGNPRMQKAVALAVFMKHTLGRYSTIANYNPNKVYRLTGVNQNTFRSYLPLMVEMGLVGFEGHNNEHLVVCRLHSKIRKRNIDIHRFCFKSFKEVYNSLRSFLALRIQQRKDFVQRTLQIANNPRNGQDCKKARNIVKRLVRSGVLKSPNETFKEWGISLKRIAKETGNCVRTAQRIVGYACKKRWWQKTTHFEATYMKNVCRTPVYGYTFTTMNYGFVVSANTYCLSVGISASLVLV